jgi:putative spermidine/putrescine transport system permease protein
MAFRKSFRGATFLFYVATASLIMPSIITSLGIARNSGRLTIPSSAARVDNGNKAFYPGLGAHLTWTLPFGLLIMFAIFNRFMVGRKPRLGATPWRHSRARCAADHIAVCRGYRSAGFTLSWDELARSSQTIALSILCHLSCRA